VSGRRGRPSSCRPNCAAAAATAPAY